jgi:hypothetical protein
MLPRTLLARRRLRFVIPVQCTHDPDARQHRVAAMSDDQHERLERRLPFWSLVLVLGQVGDELSSIARSDQLATARERDRIV